jgi:hypothetical protein
LRRKQAAVAISVALVVFLLIAYFVPFIYTGNYVTGTAKTPAPSSKIYGSLTCIIVLHLEGNYKTGPGDISGGLPPAIAPPQWNLLGTLYQGYQGSGSVH